jgi:hypothetical protein
MNELSEPRKIRKEFLEKWHLSHVYKDGDTTYLDKSKVVGSLKRREYPRIRQECV